MPLNLYLASLCTALLITGALVMCTLMLAGRIARLHGVTWRRSAVLSILFVMTSIAAVALSMSELLPWNVATVAAGCIWLILIPIFFRAGGNGWRRGVQAGVLFLMLHVPSQLVMTFALRRWVCQAFQIPTAGMDPTLMPGDRVLCDPSLMPQRWDLAVFRAPMAPEMLFVQRVVGLPGETVEIRQGRIHIDGTPIAPPAGLEWLKYSDKTVPFGFCRGGEGSPFTLKEGEFFVLGDNTEASNDSRYWSGSELPGVQVGAVPANAIRGTVRLIYAPRARMKLLK